MKVGYGHLGNPKEFENLPSADLHPLLQGKNEEKAGSQTSFVTIFSCANTMIGSGLLSLPWAFE